MKTIVKQGDTFKLGDHILACGDALNKEFIHKVARCSKRKARPLQYLLHIQLRPDVLRAKRWTKTRRVLLQPNGDMGKEHSCDR